MMILIFYDIFLPLLIAFKFEKSLANKNHEGICGKSPFECCNNYYREKDTCLECPSGRYHYNCSEKCPINHFGRLCLEICNCTPVEACDAEKGCINDGKNEKSISFQLSLMSFCVLFAILTVVLINYIYARRHTRSYSLPNSPEVCKTSGKRAEKHNNMGKKERNNINVDFAIPHSSARSIGTTPVWKSLGSRCNEIKKAEDEILQIDTMQEMDYCASHTPVSSLSDRRNSFIKKWPLSRTDSDTSLLYLRPSNQTLSSSNGGVNCSRKNTSPQSYERSTSPQSYERSTYVEVNVNQTELEESFLNSAESTFDRSSQQDTQNNVESIVEDGIYDFAFSEADREKRTEVINPRNLFYKDLSIQIQKMKGK